MATVAESGHLGVPLPPMTPIEEEQEGRSSYLDDSLIAVKRTASQDNDTDLEVDDDKTALDVSCRSLYMDSCQYHGLVPARFFLRNMNNSQLLMPHHGIGIKGAKALAISLQSSTAILNLDLSDNSMEDEGCGYIAHMLHENCYITELNLSDNMMGHKGAIAISEMLQINTVLQFLNLSGNNLGDADAQLFSDALIENNRLRGLNLSHNNFGDRTGELLGTALGDNDTVEMLDLSWNHLRGNSVVLICQAIQRNVRLREVNLSFNGLGNDVAFAIAAILKQNNPLRELDISYNRISGDGATVISKALANNDAMRVFKLNYNSIGTEGAFSMLRAITRDGSGITKLEMQGIEVDKEFTAVRKELEEMRSVEVSHGKLLGDWVYVPKPKKVKEHYIFGCRLDDFTGSNIMPVLKQYAEEHDFDVVDQFVGFDLDRDKKISLKEFLYGFELSGVEITDSDYDILENRLHDVCKDGKMDYSLFLPLGK